MEFLTVHLTTEYENKFNKKKKNNKINQSPRNFKEPQPYKKEAIEFQKSFFFHSLL